MKYWIMSDPHLGHDKIIEFCKRPTDFETKIIKSLKCIVPDDVFICLGDVAWRRELYWHKVLRMAIPCKMWLVRGNHDTRSDSWYLSAGWDFVGEFITLNRFGKNILLSHIPQKDNGYDLNIHGHFHNLDRPWFHPEVWDSRNNKQELIKIEHTYSLVRLRTIVENFNKRSSYENEKNPRLFPEYETA